MLPRAGARRSALVAALTVVASNEVAAAQAPVEPPALAREEIQARAHFERGVLLLQQESWEAALEEFLRSRDQYPTAKATINAAICLRKLQRLDVELELLESLLADSRDLPADTKAAAQREIDRVKKLVGTIAIEGAEPGAAVTIDGRRRAELPRTRPLYAVAGSRVIRVSKDGYEPFESRVDVAAEQTTRVAAPLRAFPRVDPAPTSAAPNEVPRMTGPPPFMHRPFSIEIVGAPLIAPSFGGDIARGIGIGGYGVARFGYERASGLGFGISAGFLAVDQTTTGRSVTIQPVGLAAREVTADDTLRLRAGIVSPWIGISLGRERWHVRLRLGAGPVIGRIGDSRSLPESLQGKPVGQSAPINFFSLGPEARVGVHLTERLEITAGLEALVLFNLSQSKWDTSQSSIVLKDNNTAAFPDEEAFMGTAVVLFAPGLGARYEF